MKKIFLLLIVTLFSVGIVNTANASGACCISGECVELSAAINCTNSGGTWVGPGTTCDDDPPPCGRAQGASVEISESLTTQDLGVENAGLLPTNPFYFFKNWTRAIRQVFTFNPVKKAEFELEIAHRKAAEIKKMEDVAPQNVAAITKAAANYQKNVKRLKVRLEGLQETSENPNVAKLADKLVNRGLQHERLFGELKDKFENSAEFVERASGAQEAISAAVMVVPEKLESIVEFGERVEKVVKSQKEEPFKELRAAEFVDRLEEKFAKKTEEKLVKIEEKVEQAAPEDIAKLKEELAKIREENARLRNEISAIKDDFMLKFGARLEAREIVRAEAAVAAPAPAAPQAIYQKLEELSGDKLRRSKLLDETRERASPEVKSQLNVARQNVLRQAEEQKEIGVEEAKKMISEAERLISELRDVVSAREGDISNAARQLLERAEFQLNQARSAYDAQKYGNAFGQANAARVAAENVLRPMTTAAEDYNRDLEDLRNFYDSLLKRIQEAGISREKAPKLFDLLAQAENQLLELTRLVNSKADSEQIVNGIRNTKLLLATIEQLLRELVGPVAPTAVPTPAPTAPSVSRCEQIKGNLYELTIMLREGKISEQDYKLKYEALRKELEVCERAAPTVVSAPAPGLPSLSRCDELRKDLDYLNELLKAGKISGQDYKLKYESLKKELEVCEKGEAKLPPSSVPFSAPSICTQEYNPICGINGKTYFNECHAQVDGAKIQYKGECKEGASAGGAPAPASAAPSAVAPAESFFDVFVAIDEGGQFSPAAVKVKKGGKVTWTNKSQRPVWPASAIHPTHTVYPEPGGCIGSKFDACRELKPGETFTFVFNQVGGWKYHDHLNPGSTGAVEVFE